MKDNIVYIDLLTDYGFKHVFGDKEDKYILMASLNACLADFTETITELTFLPTEKLGDKPSEKRVIFDLYCKNQRGEHFIIELQRTSQHFYADRSISYVSRIISSELQRGDRFYHIPRVYSINILEFNADEFAGRENYFWSVQLKDNDNEIFSKKIMLVFIELNKFAARNKESEFRDELQKWIYILKNISKMECPDPRLQDDVFLKLFEKCKYSKLDNMEKEKYRKSVLEYEDVQDAVSYAEERALAAGYEKGKAEGEAKGHAKGLAEGHAEGLAEGKVKIARTMLENNFDIATISRLTGLSEEEIRKL